MTESSGPRGGRPNPLSQLDLQRVTALYQESCRGVAMFIEWRHKVMLLATGTLALAFIATSWIYTENITELAMALPLALGALISIQCVRFERRLDPLLRMCYAAASECEHLLSRGIDEPKQPDEVGTLPQLPLGVWSRVNQSRMAQSEASTSTGGPILRRNTFGAMMPQLYIYLAVLFAAGMAAAITVGIVNLS